MKDKRIFKNQESSDKPVVYVIGRGHSGTTVLDLVLGRGLGFRSTGELVSGLGRIEDEVCTCGQKVFSCSAWMGPSAEVFSDTAKFREYARTASGLARIKMFPQVPLILFGEKYRQALHDESRFLQALTGSSSGLIDSSKELVRGILLGLGPSQAYWVHLIRNPIDVINSARSRSKKGPLKIYRVKFYPPDWLLPVVYLILGIIWLVWTLVTFLLGKTLLRKKYLCVVYEDFVSDPVGTVWNVSELVGCELSKGEINENLNGDIEVGHILGGNRMARAGRFRIVKPGKSMVPLSVRAFTFWLYPVYRLFSLLK